ncbi:MAG TPA: DUF2061 domain-containing protein [Verrucomicrobiae bacterium]|nr:DUF2061 domain-containing protein [Verrucomicrobiae bacterium]
MSWRFIATVVTTSVVWLLTGKGKFALTVGLIDTTIKLAAYFFHERIWLRVPFGRKNIEYEI